MTKLNWHLVTRDHVINAIQKFLQHPPKYPPGKTTFLMYNNQELPAKHIRGMAYKEACGYEPSKSDYTGGQETKRFFEQRGFSVKYVTSENRKGSPSAEDTSLDVRTSSLANDADKEEMISVNYETVNPDKFKGIIAEENLKVALYLQSDSVKNHEEFQKAVEILTKSDVDLVVFPEYSWTPFFNYWRENNFFPTDLFEQLRKDSLALSENIGKPIIINQGVFVNNGSEDVGIIFSVFANANASTEETDFELHFKNTQTDYSILDYDSDESCKEDIVDNFPIILLKGYRIGMTVCYDCTDSLFSRIYGLKGVDVIINSTGGDVVREKWYRYIKARAIENNCYSLVTMGCDDPSKNFVLGFYPNGNEMSAECLNGINCPANNSPGGLYVFNISMHPQLSTFDEDLHLHQKTTVCKYQNIYVSEKSPQILFEDTKKLTEDIYVKKLKDNSNLIIFKIEGDEIFKPEKVLTLFYSDKIAHLQKRKFIIYNHYSELPEDKRDGILSTILKVRSMESFCPVILHGPNETKVIQVGNTKNIQILKLENGQYGIDLNRATGPKILRESMTRNQKKICSHYKWMIDNLLVSSL